jgi:hypothetical protein
MLIFANLSKPLIAEHLLKGFRSVVGYLPYRHHILIFFHPLAHPFGGKKPNIAGLECMVAQFVLY